jgi:hypothetical protein
LILQATIALALLLLLLLLVVMSVRVLLRRLLPCRPQ